MSRHVFSGRRSEVVHGQRIGEESSGGTRNFRCLLWQTYMSIIPTMAERAEEIVNQPAAWFVRYVVPTSCASGRFFCQL
jgi:hypothetical protein